MSTTDLPTALVLAVLGLWTHWLLAKETYLHTVRGFTARYAHLFGFSVFIVGGGIGFLASHLFIPLLHSVMDMQGIAFFCSIIGTTAMILGYWMGEMKRISSPDADTD